MSIRSLEPKLLWNHFADLNAIPRPSKKEDRVIAFMKDFGNQLGLETFEDAMTMTADTRTQGFSIPFIRATSTGSEYYMLEVLNASSTENTIGKDNARLFRSSMVWVVYILSALGILTILLKRK